MNITSKLTRKTMLWLALSVVLGLPQASSVRAQSSAVVAPSAAARYDYAEPTDMKTAFSRAIEEAKAGTVLMAFDVDNTLLATDQDLGSEQWYEGEAKRLDSLAKSDPKLFMRRLNQLLDVNTAVSRLTTTRLTQTDIPGLVKLLPADVKVVAITSRGPALVDPTTDGFRSNGLAFGSFFPGDIHYPASGHDVLCREGICLTAGANKGEALVGFLNAVNYHPRAVIFVDNDPTPVPPGPHDPNDPTKGKHHPRVKKWGTEAGIPVLVGYRYSKQDAAMDEYEAGTKAVAVAQLREFRKSGKLISNREASALTASLPASKEALAKQMSLLLYGVEAPGQPDPQ
ncbi:MAG: DUF2608 domain-containing protein [Elusimicrobiota bacterium]